MPRAPQHKPAPPTVIPDGARGPDIDPRWLLKMLAVTIGGALFCGYLTLCGLFYQGQWQLVLHPDTATTITPASVNLPFEDVSFDYTETGQPQLHGWWIPAAGNAPAGYSAFTILYLHGGNGSLADTLPRLQELHHLGLNVFAFDYRGFGQSAGLHPNELRMREDTAAALALPPAKTQPPALRRSFPTAKESAAHSRCSFSQMTQLFPPSFSTNPSSTFPRRFAGIRAPSSFPCACSSVSASH